MCSFTGATWDIPGQFYSSQVMGAVGSVLPGERGCICLPTHPPLSCVHQANWSTMWGRGITTRRAPLYGISSFYTFCCITVQDDGHTECIITGCPNNKAYHYMALNHNDQTAAIIQGSAYNFQDCLKHRLNFQTWMATSGF